MRNASRLALIPLGLLAALPLVAAPPDLPAPVTDADYLPVAMDETRLGQQLFYDPILSGNRNVACATCHHPAFGTSDGLSLGLGDGGTGLGPNRRIDPQNPPEQRIPRNAPGLFNLGAREFTVLFHDGRIEADPTRPSGLRTPMGSEMEVGFASLLSAQTMFPVLSADEMAGHYSENDVAKAVRMGRITGPGGAWDIIARRVADIPAYAAQFEQVYGKSPEEIHFTDISDAIAAFMEFEWRSDNSPFDAMLRGERALPEPAAQGMDLFYGKAQCATCHAGPFQTDHGFHAMAAPQIGPGKAARFESHAQDTGRMRVTGDTANAYAFRTPSLRNVAQTAPYGHAGGHSDLGAFVRAHANPVAGLEAYDLSQARLPKMDTDDTRATLDSAETAAIIQAVSWPGVFLSDIEINQLLAFLHSLSDPVALTGRLGVPDRVPSGLPVDQPSE